MGSDCAHSSQHRRSSKTWFKESFDTAAVSTAYPTMAESPHPSSHHAVARINNALRALGQFSGNTTVVCDATVEEWNAFVGSEDQVVGSRYMVWCADEKQILLVDFPPQEHELFKASLDHIFMGSPEAMRYIKPEGASYNRNDYTRPLYEPDLSSGPMYNQLAPLGVVPPVADWANYITLTVEIGYCCGWGHDRGTLDWKTRTVWSQVPGVEYVLCVKVEEYFTSASYKLYSIQQTGHSPPFIDDPTLILPPTTVVQFDTVRFLGAQPPRFPPTISLDLYAVLTLARRGRRPPPSASNAASTP